jgi:ABC-type amino acid transport substrate-binding protein/serine phosphatase RsbU (regulator of sigma subunit)
MIRVLFHIVFLGSALSLWSQEPVIEFSESEQKWIEKHPVVYYGYDPEWQPIEFAENREHSGITRDYVNLLSERIGFQLKAHPEANSWQKSVELFKRYELSILVSVGKNEERDKYMNYTDSHQSHSWVIVTDRHGEFVGSVDDLRGKRVATPRGYWITSRLENESFEMEFVYTASIEESLLEITLGNADATVSNIAVISHYLNYSGYENLKIAAPADYPDMEAYMGVVKNEETLLHILNKGLRSITHQERNAIVQNWVSVKFEHGVDMAKVWTIAGISIGVVGLIFGFFVYWNRKLKKEVSRRKEAEEALQESFEEISAQKLLIEEKNEEVMDSIKYAKRIQQAILPTVDRINQLIPNNFLMYLPKDIVAGDFYWLEAIRSDEHSTKVLIAAADCTGHGVPGAMVSVVCSNALNKSVLEYGLVDPGKILDKTTDLVIERFSKSDEDVKDGMDIGLSGIEFKADGSAEIEFAGAHNHLWVISKRTDLGVESQVLEEDGSDFCLHEIKASKQPVGQFINRGPFKTTKLTLSKGERFFLYSDGYADQFGGELGKKFKNKSFKRLLINTMNIDIKAQGSSLREKFEEWKGEFEQLDDVCVIGVEI